MITEELLDANVGKLVKVTLSTWETHEGYLGKDGMMFFVGPDYFTHHHVRELIVKG